jgi:hypothetical protein
MGGIQNTLGAPAQNHSIDYANTSLCGLGPLTLKPKIAQAKVTYKQ